MVSTHASAQDFVAFCADPYAAVLADPHALRSRLTARRFVDLARTQSMICRRAPV